MISIDDLKNVYTYLNYTQHVPPRGNVHRCDFPEVQDLGLQLSKEVANLVGRPSSGGVSRCPGVPVSYPEKMGRSWG